MVKPLALLFALALTACGTTDIHDYADSKPTLDMRTFFSGELRAYGILQNRQGKVTRKFTADLVGRWKGNTGYLDEVFYFDDGETDTRNWVLELQPNGKITGTAGDVIGSASGQVAGSTLHWVYTLDIPYKNDSIHIKIDDWLYLINEDKLLNKSVLTKWGFRIGELTLVIERINPPSS